MLVRIQFILIYSILILFYLCDGKYVTNTNEYVGTVRNLSVEVLKDPKYIEKQDAYKFLKLNISWLPPNTFRQPSSYSIIITGIPSIEEKTNIIKCSEGSLFYILKQTQDKKFNVLLPEYSNLDDIPDLYIKPDCSYKVQVLANPRTKYITNIPEVLYTVPKCINNSCNCINAKRTLPIPKVNISQRGNQIVINWSTTFNTANIQFYIIKIGIPLFISRKGLPVYNVTKIGQIPVNKTMFLYDLKINNQNIQIKNDYKIIISAVNYYGCFGPEETFIINFTSSNIKIWFILIGVIISCILIGILSFILYHNYNFFMMKQKVRTISKCKWTETILQQHNILYIKHESKEKHIEQTNKLNESFESVKLIRKLGIGQFGKVYLGHLNDKNNSLVAVKMSQQMDLSIDSETRQQFIQEIEIMIMAGNHPHLVSLIGYCIKPNHPICILLEYMKGGDLLTYLHNQRNQQNKQMIYHDQNILQDLCETYVSKTLYTNICSTILNKTNSYRSKQYINITNNYKEKVKNENESWIGKMERHQFLKFAKEIAMGMEHLEAKGITHRDLAARNILLTEDLTVKISDFGLSRNGVYVIKNTEEKTHHLPIRWMSPEALYNRAFSSKSDVWSFGIVLWEISTLGGFPYCNIQDDHLLHYIVHKNGRLEQPDNVPSSIYKLMHSCWATEPQNRPNFTQLLSKLQILIASLDNTFLTISNPCYALSLSEKTFI